MQALWSQRACAIREIQEFFHASIYDDPHDGISPLRKPKEI